MVLYNIVLQHPTQPSDQAGRVALSRAVAARRERALARRRARRQREAANTPLECVERWEEEQAVPCPLLETSSPPVGTSCHIEVVAPTDGETHLATQQDNPLAEGTDQGDAYHGDTVTEEAPIEEEAPSQDETPDGTEDLEEEQTPLEALAEEEAPLETLPEVEAPLETLPVMETPVEAPVEVPVATTMEAPVEAPVEAEVEAPMEATVEAAVKAAVEAPVEAPLEALPVVEDPLEVESPLSMEVLLATLCMHLWRCF